VWEQHFLIEDVVPTRRRPCQRLFEDAGEDALRRLVLLLFRLSIFMYTLYDL
jgi:hypothetical protein